MTTQYIETSLTCEERETLINCSIDSNGAYVWEAESSIPAHITKFRKAGWKETGQLIARSTGAVQSATFRAVNKKPLTFRNLAKPTCVMSEEEKQQKREQMTEYHNKRKISV